MLFFLTLLIKETKFISTVNPVFTIVKLITITMGISFFFFFQTKFCYNGNKIVTIFVKYIYYNVAIENQCKFVSESWESWVWSYFVPSPEGVNAGVGVVSSVAPNSLEWGDLLQCDRTQNWKYPKTCDTFKIGFKLINKNTMCFNNFTDKLK